MCTWEGRPLTMKAETGVMQLQTKDLRGMPEPPEAGERKGTILPQRLQRGHGPANTLFRTLAFRIVRE